MLPAALALTACRHRNLVRRTRAFAGWLAIEDAPVQRLEEREVIEPLAALLLEGHAGLPLERADLGRDLVAHPGPDELRIGRIARLVTLLVTRDERFDLANVLVLGRAEPRPFGLGRGDAGDLACGGERQIASAHRLGDERQLFDRVGDAQPLDRSARRVTALVLHIVDETRVAVRSPDAQCLGVAQGGGFHGVELGASASDALELAVDARDALCVVSTVGAPLSGSLERTIAQHHTLLCL